MGKTSAGSYGISLKMKDWGSSVLYTKCAWALRDDGLIDSGGGRHCDCNPTHGDHSRKRICQTI